MINYKSPKPFPFLPQGCEIVYVAKDNQFILEAKKIAMANGCTKQATGAVIVIKNKIVASGTNAGIRVAVCPRVIEKCPTGTGYHHCKTICQQEGHAEEQACKDFLAKKLDPTNATIYLWGHWWCCTNCWTWMQKLGLAKVHLPEGATEDFDLDASKA